MSMIEKQIDDLLILRESMVLKNSTHGRQTIDNAIETIRQLSAKCCEVDAKLECEWETKPNQRFWIAETSCGKRVRIEDDGAVYCKYCGMKIKVEQEQGEQIYCDKCTLQAGIEGTSLCQVEPIIDYMERTNKERRVDCKKCIHKGYKEFCLNCYHGGVRDYYLEEEDER